MSIQGPANEGELFRALSTGLQAVKKASTSADATNRGENLQMAQNYLDLAKGALENLSGSLKEDRINTFAASILNLEAQIKIATQQGPAARRTFSGTAAYIAAKFPILRSNSPKVKEAFSKLDKADKFLDDLEKNVYSLIEKNLKDPGGGDNLDFYIKRLERHESELAEIKDLSNPIVNQRKDLELARIRGLKASLLVAKELSLPKGQESLSPSHLLRMNSIDLGELKGAAERSSDQELQTVWSSVKSNTLDTIKKAKSNNLQAKVETAFKEQGRALKPFFEQVNKTTDPVKLEILAKDPKFQKLLDYKLAEARYFTDQEFGTEHAQALKDFGGLYGIYKASREQVDDLNLTEQEKNIVNKGQYDAFLNKIKASKDPLGRETLIRMACSCVSPEDLQELRPKLPRPSTPQAYMVRCQTLMENGLIKTWPELKALLEDYKKVPDKYGPDKYKILEFNTALSEMLNQFIDSESNTEVLHDIEESLERYSAQSEFYTTTNVNVFSRIFEKLRSPSNHATSIPRAIGLVDPKVPIDIPTGIQGLRTYLGLEKGQFNFISPNTLQDLSSCLNSNLIESLSKQAALELLNATKTLLEKKPEQEILASKILSLLFKTASQDPEVRMMVLKFRLDQLGKLGDVPRPTDPGQKETLKDALNKAIEDFDQNKEIFPLANDKRDNWLINQALPNVEGLKFDKTQPFINILMKNPDNDLSKKLTPLLGPLGIHQSQLEQLAKNPNRAIAKAAKEELAASKAFFEDLKSVFIETNGKLKEFDTEALNAAIKEHQLDEKGMATLSALFKAGLFKTGQQDELATYLLESTLEQTLLFPDVKGVENKIDDLRDVGLSLDQILTSLSKVIPAVVKEGDSAKLLALEQGLELLRAKVHKEDEAKSLATTEKLLTDLKKSIESNPKLSYERMQLLFREKPPKIERNYPTKLGEHKLTDTEMEPNLVKQAKNVRKGVVREYLCIVEGGDLGGHFDSNLRNDIARSFITGSKLSRESVEKLTAQYEANMSLIPPREITASRILSILKAFSPLKDHSTVAKLSEGFKQKPANAFLDRFRDQHGLQENELRILQRQAGKAVSVATPALVKEKPVQGWDEMHKFYTAVKLGFVNQEGVVLKEKGKEFAFFNACFELAYTELAHVENLEKMLEGLERVIPSETDIDGQEAFVKETIALLKDNLRLHREFLSHLTDFSSLEKFEEGVKKEVLADSVLNIVESDTGVVLLLKKLENVSLKDINDKEIQMMAVSITPAGVGESQMDLKANLVKVVQRTLKYPLHLTDMAKQALDSSENPLLQGAIEKVKAASREVNAQMKTFEEGME